MGEHGGTAGYTVGQRQGLGVALGEPRYVSRIDPLTNTITLGRREDLETTTIELERATFVAGDAPAGATIRSVPRSGSATARHRSRPPSGRRRRRAARGGRWLVETDRPVWAAAPGQAAVLYDGDVVLGGGRIAGLCRSALPRPTVARGPDRRTGQDRNVSLNPALILAILVGIFHASLFVLIRGTAGGRLPSSCSPRSSGRGPATRWPTDSVSTC